MSVIFGKRVVILNAWWLVDWQWGVYICLMCKTAARVSRLRRQLTTSQSVGGDTDWGDDGGSRSKKAKIVREPVYLSVHHFERFN